MVVDEGGERRSELVMLQVDPARPVCYSRHLEEGWQARVGSGKRDRVQLRALTRAEQRVLARKLKDLSLAARFHRRYQIVAAARGAPLVSTVTAKVGCHWTVVYDWIWS